MTVAAIRQSSPGRLTVILEDGEEIKSSLAVVTELRLFSGKELDGEALAELRRLSCRSLARDKAIELLSRRLMSRRELKEKLIQKGQDEDTAEFCAAWLEANGFINDENYAAALVRHYAAKGYGQGRIRGEFSRRGVPRELWDAALEAMPENEDKLDKFISSRLADPEDRDQIRKISSALYRRGYSWEEIRSALRRHQAQAEDY